MRVICLTVESHYVDYTTGELDSRLDRYFGEEKEAMLSRRYQVIK